MTEQTNQLIGKLVLVDWIDAATPGGGWKDLKAALSDPKLYRIYRATTVGFVIDEKPDVVTLASLVGDLGGYDQCGQEILIPRAAIKHLAPLKTPNKRTNKLIDKAGTAIRKVSAVAKKKNG